MCGEQAVGTKKCTHEGSRDSACRARSDAIPNVYAARTIARRVHASGSYPLLIIAKHEP